MSRIAHYLKDIGRGARGAKPLAREQAAELFGLILDGELNELQLGAFCLAMRMKGETTAEMAGFLDATQARLQSLPASSRPVIVLPSYNGARKLPVLTPLLALLLAREGLPVLIHGHATEDRRVLARDVLALLGVAPRTHLQAIAPGEVAVVPTGLLHPGLTRLLDVRRAVGLRNTGHSVVKLMQPVNGPAVVVGSYTHPAFFTLMAELFEWLGTTALLSRGLEGEVVSDPRRTPQLNGFVHGQPTTLQAQQPGTQATVEGLPTAIDAASTADYTRRVLAGELPVPPALATQVAHLQALSLHA